VMEQMSTIIYFTFEWFPAATAVPCALRAGLQKKKMKKMM